MAVHVVGFIDALRDGSNSGYGIPFGSRQLLWALYDTQEYKALKPGDRKSTWPLGQDEYVDFVEPDSFNADLTLIEANYYSESTVTLHDELNDTYYPMFKTDFLKMVRSALLDHGRVSGHFGYTKKNVNFGIIYLGEKQENG